MVNGVVVTLKVAGEVDWDDMRAEGGSGRGEPDIVAEEQETNAVVGGGPEVRRTLPKKDRRPMLH
jgi:hypothetical protein